MSAGTSGPGRLNVADEVVTELCRRAPGTTVPQPQRVTRGMVRSARLIVTATRAHRVAVTKLDRTAVERAVTLKELARILADEEPGIRFDAVLDRVRAGVLAEDRLDHDDDLDDPYGLDEAAYQHMFAEVDAALTVLVPALAGGR